MSNCRVESNQKVFVFEENKSKLSLINKNEVISTKIKVDGCEINDKRIEKCDYLHIAKEIEFYIELKGQDLGKAMNQIKNTIRILSRDVKKQYKKSYIICTRSPLTSTKIQSYKREFKKDYNSELIIKSSPCTDSY